jgi:hypothetical protein
MPERLVGECDTWCPDKLKAVVEALVDADEVELALKALDCVPARYRDVRNFDLERLRCDILSAMVTPHAYLSSGLDCEVSYSQAQITMAGTARGLYILDEVKRYNQKLLSPHIVDFGPGEYFIPLGLADKQCNFTYDPIAMDQKAKVVADDLLHSLHIGKIPVEGSPYIFIAFEIIEHLPGIMDIATEALSRGTPERVYLSTPLYTYDGTGPKNWRKKNGLPHLRAYTPNEFLKACMSLFPTYTWQIDTRGLNLLARGMNPDKLDQEPLPIQTMVMDIPTGG